MRVLALVAVIAVVAPADAGPRTGRAGRIVRVERPRTGARGTPRICQFSPSDKSASCFGLAPAVGDLGSLVTADGLAGQVRVTKVGPQTAGGAAAAACMQGLWRADVEVLDPELTANPNGIMYGGWLIFDVGLAANAKIVDPPTELPAGVAGETAAVTLDRDGTEPADFMVTWYPCQGTSATYVAGSSQTYCVDYWFAGGTAWSKQRQDVVTWCM